MRKGFTLVETLIVVFVLPFMLLILDGLFRTLIKDIPRSYKIVQENTSLLSMLNEIQQDIDKAKGLPETYNEYVTNDMTLLIELPEGIVCYQTKNKKVIRFNLKDKTKGYEKEKKYWPVPHAKVHWKVWRKDMKGYAVEVRTHIEQKIQGHLQKKMANSHLYFMGAL